MSFSDQQIPDKLPRWAQTDAGAPSAHIEEPPSQQQDVGWEPTEPGNAQWWNWLHGKAYEWLAYFQRTWATMWDQSFVARDGSTTCQVSARSPAVMGVNVAAGRVWYQGGFYEVPASAVSVTAAHPTLARIDLVIVEINAPNASVKVVTGTPSATPVAPSTTDNQIALAQIVVGAGVASITSPWIEDLRQLGRLALGGLRVDKQARIGDIGGGAYALSYSEDRLTQTLAVDPGVAKWREPIERRLAWTGQRMFPGSPEAPGGTGGTGAQINLDPSERIPLHLPNGAVITEIRIWGDRTDTADTFGIILWSGNLLNGSETEVARAETEVGDGVGSLTIESVDNTNGLATVTDALTAYEIEFVADENSGSGLEVWGAEIVYTVASPAQGL